MVYKQDEQFRSWLNGLYKSRTKFNGRSSNHFRMCDSLLSTVRVFQQALTVESNSWTTPLVLRLLPSGNVSARYCWNGSMLIVSGSFILACFYNRTRESNWSVPIDCPQGPCSLVLLISHAGPLSDRAGWLITRLSNCTGRLIDPLSDSAHSRPVLNQADQFIIQLNG